MHAFKVVFALWLMAYALCVRFHSSENTTQLTEGAAQLDSKGGFTTVRHILQPTVGNESESQGIENHSGMPKMNGTLENHSVLQAATQIGNETEIVATPSGPPMALNSSTKMNGALIQLHSSNKTAIVETRGNRTGIVLKSCPYIKRVASCSGQCNLPCHCSIPYSENHRVKCVPAASMGINSGKCRPSNRYIVGAIWCPEDRQGAERLKQGFIGEAGNEEMDGFVKASRRHLIDFVKGHAIWCKFLVGKREQVHVAADIDGTLATFATLEQPRKDQWTGRVRHALEQANSLSINIAYTTGNPLWMVQARGLPVGKTPSGVFSGGADVRWNGAIKTNREADWLDYSKDRRIWEHMKTIQKNLLNRFKERAPIIVWMSDKSLIVHDDLFEGEKGKRRIHQLEEEGPGSKNVLTWNSAKMYLTSNLPLQEQQNVVQNEFENRLKSFSIYERERMLGEGDYAQIAYIKGLGRGNQPESDKYEFLLTELGIQDCPKADLGGDGCASVVEGVPTYKVTFLTTHGHHEFFVCQQSVSKTNGLNQLEVQIPKANLVLGLGDSANDIDVRNHINDNQYVNAIFVGTADFETMDDGKWKLSTRVTGDNFKISKLGPTTHNVFPGFAYDALELLMDLVYVARNPGVLKGANPVDYTYDSRWNVESL